MYVLSAAADWSSCGYISGIAAGLQPISDKRMVRAVSSLGQALGMIVYIMMITLVLFVLTIAIICVATNCVSV